LEVLGKLFAYLFALICSSTHKVIVGCSTGTVAITDVNKLKQADDQAADPWKWSRDCLANLE